VLGKVDKAVGRIEERQLIALNFLRRVTELQQAQEARCPSVFTLTAEREGLLRKKLMTLRFYCEQPQAWHPMPGDAGSIRFERKPDWFISIAPHLRMLVQILQHLAPVIVPAADAIGIPLDNRWRAELALMKEFADQLPELARAHETNFSSPDMPTKVAGTDGDFRALESMLTELDPSRRWGGLSRVTTSDGLTIHVCANHLATYDYPATPRTAHPPADR
jgi:internalin A